MTIPIVATAIRLLWTLIEYPYLRRNRVQPTRDWDKHSRQLWDVANLVEPIGMILGFAHIGSFPIQTKLIGAIGLFLLAGGITIRGVAIHTLGKYFTGTVLIKDDHRLIQTGLYKHVRHPAYTGALLAHLGLGLSFSNWFSLALSSIPYLAVALYRMHVEEQALKEGFGTEYVDYSKTTKRLIPRVY
jgi:protein-S-isoprenylcysteine O-methyltransferase Ste14